jgi:1-acyl-sn-glycerol-3-phosphate acyltransferase
VPTQPAPSQTAPDRRAREVREGNWCYLIAKWICRAFFVLVFWTKRYDPRNVPAAGAVIIASNHQSYFDPVIVGSCNRRIMQYMARDTLFRNRMFGRLIRTFNAFPVKRGATDVTAIKHSLRLLREGKALLLFPEGTRTADGRVGSAQPGVVALARRSRAPIVPVAVDGVYEAWPRGQRLPRWARFHVAYGEPLDAKMFAKLDDQQAADRLTRAMRDLHNEVRQRAGRPPFEYADAEESVLPQAGTEPRENHGMQP